MQTPDRNLADTTGRARPAFATTAPDGRAWDTEAAFPAALQLFIPSLAEHPD